jgi:putative peptidoglycan lipid II flippase
MGIFAIGISTVVFPLMAGFAVDGDLGGLKETLNYALRLVFFILIPAGVGLMILGKPIISVLFAHGRFLQDGSTDPTNWALLFYSVGLFAYGGVSIVVRAFYALEDTRTPVRVGCCAVCVNVFFDLILMGPLQHGGLALATSLASIFQIMLLIYLLRHKVGRIGFAVIAHSLVRIGLSTAAMAVACVAVMYAFPVVSPVAPIKLRLAAALFPLAAAVAAYWVSASLLHMTELGELKQAFIRKRATL